VAPFQNFVSCLPIASSGIMGEQTALQKVSSMILWSCFCWSYSKAASQVLFREIAIPDCTVYQALGKHSFKTGPSLKIFWF